ncbi:MAG TPA: hypothetical protein VE983_05285 [Solirubrobacteraceae bacterium]|nr:hypothetical protein [Solirubrobacteraceae bacterium]
MITGLLVPLIVVAASGAHSGRGLAAHAQPKPSIFGLNTATLDSNHPNAKKDFSRASQLGARWVRLTDDNIQWQHGKPDYSTLNLQIRLAQAQGLGILISLGGDPNACSIHPTPSNPAKCPPTSAKNLQVYKQFLQQELLHFSSDVTYYESWIQPNEPGRWPPEPKPAQYAALLKAQYSVFQAVNKKHGLHLKLLFGGPVNFSIGPGGSSKSGIAVLPFTHAVLGDLSGQKPFDGIAINGYRLPPATRPPTYSAFDDIQGLPAAQGAHGPYPAQGCNNTGTWCKMTWPQELSAYEQEFMNHYATQLPMWVTQFGWPGSKTVPPGQPADDYPSYAQQKQDLTEAYGDLLHLGSVQAAFWYNLRDYQPGVPSSAPPFFAHYGLLQYNSTPKPAGNKFKSLSRANPGR